LELLRVPIYHENSGPDFVPRPSTRSIRSTFEVSVFENGESDFVVPLELFMWRTHSLERAIEECGSCSGIPLTDFFVNSEAEDSRFDPYSCELSTIIPDDDECESHFHGSGYNALQLTYEGSNSSAANIWEVTVSGKEDQCPLPPCLTDDQTSALIEILNSLESDEYVKAAFSAPVDTRRFMDYEQMVEVPIDLSFIKQRLQHKYYTNVHSVLADMKLLRDNCIKYNKDGSEITTEANKMFQNFEKSFEDKHEVLGCEAGERDGSMEFDMALRSIQRQRRSSRREALRRSDHIVSIGFPGVQNPGSSPHRSPRSSQRRQASSIRTSPSVPRIRLSARRVRQRNRNSSVEPSAQQSRLGSDEGFDHSSTNITVVIAGKSYKYPDDDISSDIDVEFSVDDDSEILKYRRSRAKASNTKNSPVVEEVPFRGETNVRRQSSRLREKKVMEESFDDEYSDGLEEHGSDYEDQANANFRRNSSFEEECSDEHEDYESDSEDDENSSDHHRRVSRSNRKHMQDSDNKNISTVRAVGRNTRSSSRTAPNQVESLQETFNRRRTTTESRATEYLSSTNHRRSRSSIRTSSALENLPQPSLLTSPPARSSRRRNQNAVSYEEYSCSEIEEEDEDSHGHEFHAIENSDLAGRKRPRKVAVKNGTAYLQTNFYPLYLSFTTVLVF
jgi:Transcription factor involved in chromatin remodeling, contains bromodomain